MFKQKPNPEIEFAKQQQQKEMTFAKEQQNMQIGSQDDQTALEIQQEKNDLLRWQQDLDDEIQDLVHTLKSEIKTEDGWQRKKIMVDGKIVNARPLCNDRFIHEVVIPQCKPFVSRNLINSNLDTKTILDSLRTTCNDIADTMADHFDEYGIEFTNFDIVVRNIKNIIRPGNFRALNGFNKKQDGTIIRRVESSNDNPYAEQKKKGMMSVFT